jgi:hypothetical protein
MHRVQSDLTLEGYITGDHGDVEKLTTYEVTGRHLHPEDATHIPHIHRLGPREDALATFSPATGLVTLTSVGRPEGTLESARTIRLEGLNGQVIRNLRWTQDGGQWVVQTDNNLYLARIPTVEAAPKAVVTPVFVESGKVMRVDDYRVHPHGVLVRVGWSRDPGLSAGLYFFDLSGNTPKRHSFTQPKGGVSYATILAGGRIVRTVPSPQKMGRTWLGAIETYNVTPGQAPVLVDTVECSGHDCNVANWAPGADHLVLATHAGNILFENPDSTDISSPFIRRQLPLSPPGLLWGHEPIHTLWASPSNARVLAASKHSLSVFDRYGTVLWSWKPDEGAIHSAHFDIREEAVLVGVNDRILRLQEGKPPEVIFVSPWNHKPSTASALKRSRRAGVRTRTFVDDVVPLRDGRVAFNWVTVKETDEHRGGSRYRPVKRKSKRSKRKN